MKSLIFLMVALMMVTPAFAGVSYQEDADQYSGTDAFDLGTCDAWTDGSYATACGRNGNGVSAFAYFNYTVPEGVNITANYSQYFSYNKNTPTPHEEYLWFNGSVPQECMDNLIDGKLVFLFYSTANPDDGCFFSTDCKGAGGIFVNMAISTGNNCGTYSSSFIDEGMTWDGVTEVPVEPSKYAYLEDVGNGIGLFLYYTGEAVARFVLFLGLVAGVTSIIYAVALLVRGIIRGSSK